ncbi:glycosyltransferase [Aliirhizobium smilacinae]|uniref:Glycosyltransferase n=1 Tax=Aliirhizobium smilacinae TaxID=1395944 RepID=A0A5C4XTA0_9HYPH|nr:glycosyltransferase [Rhizobium smilacinae]TNM65820.1 glycosyltransferase [Rhizobium smilacinae]
MGLKNSFAVNGRFLTHAPTGVQRYALNVLKALDEASGGDPLATLLLPSGAVDPGLKSFERIEISSRLKGHAWEQCALPLNWRGPLLNLCNTAPIAKKEQIVCIHDGNVFAAPDSYSLAFRTAYKSIQPVLARRATRIATVSHASARQLARYLPIDAKDIAVLPNGHEHVLQWNADAAEVAPGIVSSIATRSRRYVFALGSRAKHKNLSLLSKIAAELDALGIDIVVAGGDFGIFSESTAEQPGNVIMAGRVSDDDIAYFLKHALCLAFPSLNEGFGLPVVEAMALGCPVISSYHSSMAEVCGDAALLASPFDPAQWVKHVETLKNSASVADDLRAKGFVQTQKFSWRETAAGYRELLERPTARLASRQAEVQPIARVAVAIATRGRPAVVSQTIGHLLATQTLAPERVILSCVDRSDAGDLADDHRVEVITGKAGLPAQRNNALEHLKVGIDVVVFLDDDFVADPNWLATAARAFADESSVVGFTGRVVADGIKGPGIPFDEAVRLVEQAPAANGPGWERPFSPYGCNMAYRVSAIGDNRFDERLVLYGWLEDRDFGASLAKKSGDLVKCAEAYGVHMGVKVGRVSGQRLGYSQVINPVYLRRKGTMTTKQAIGQIWRNMSMNFAKSLSPEPFIDRRGRVKGNLRALLDLFRGQINPERAASLEVAPTKLERLGGGVAR